MGAGTRQISLVKWVLFTFYFLPVFSHIMGTLRTSTVVLAALLAAVTEFCLFCLVCGLGCCSFFLFLVRLFSLASSLMSWVFSSCSCSCLRGKEEGTLFFPLLSLVFLYPSRIIVRSPCEVLVS